jgi:predicted O-linked N-acetylglucosamine transferase (SPINDLY family)
MLAEAWVNRGNALNELGRHDEALLSHDRAVDLNPDFAEAWANRGVTLSELRCYEKALASYDRAIKINPNHANAWSNRGNLLNDLKRHGEALISCDRSIEIDPNHAEAWYNRGNCFMDLKREEDALHSYEKAIEIRSDFAEAWSNRGNALRSLKRYEEAVASYQRSIDLKPNIPYVLGDLLHTQMKICDWSNLQQWREILQERLLAGEKASAPFPVLGLFDSPWLQKKCAEVYAKDQLSPTIQLGAAHPRTQRNKIRVGYFSMDFREHPVSHLMAGLIECHDRSEFEIYGFSFGINTDDRMRQRLEKAFDKFFEVRDLSELDIARLAQEQELDIAVDLGGYTQDSRPRIFAHRAAPIQINYLGYPGTMGSGSIDYLIADPVLIPDDLQSAYSEKIIYLPNSYQVNDSKRLTSDRIFTREELGLPPSGFVFCCFNNPWKMTPEILSSWARILAAVSNSVLWLFNDNPFSMHHLKAEAKTRGIPEAKLTMAESLPNSEHLARYPMADLFLDTFPYGAHTSASDSLWAGVPVVTRLGTSFASRVAASLLNALALPELVTRDLDEYESLAIELATNSEKFARVKSKLARNRLTSPLFDTKGYTKHLELAFKIAHDRYQSNIAPNHIHLSL